MWQFCFIKHYLISAATVSMNCIKKKKKQYFNQLNLSSHAGTKNTATGTHSLLHDKLSPWRGLGWTGKNFILQRLKEENRWPSQPQQDVSHHFNAPQVQLLNMTCCSGYLNKANSVFLQCVSSESTIGVWKESFLSVQWPHSLLWLRQSKYGWGNVQAADYTPLTLYAWLRDSESTLLECVACLA